MAYFSANHSIVKQWHQPLNVSKKSLLRVRVGDRLAERLQSTWGKRFSLFHRFQFYIIICVNVLIFGALWADLFVLKSHWSALHRSTSRILVFICFCPPSDIAVLAYSLSDTDKCSPSLSHTLHVFTTNSKFNSYTTFSRIINEF